MHQPVTNDPFVIMIINMVIVFAVLIAVWGLIEITHMIDPTKKKSDPPAAQAVGACGCSASQIQSIRPSEQPAWTGFGRVSGMRS